MKPTQIIPQHLAATSGSACAAFGRDRISEKMTFLAENSEFRTSHKKPLTNRKTSKMDNHQDQQAPESFESFLLASIARAQSAAAACLAVHQFAESTDKTEESVACSPFSSLEEWLQFDSSLDEWLASRKAASRRAA